MKKIGIIGYGHLGQYLVKNVINDQHFELAFVYNRDVKKIGNEVPQEKIMENLDDFKRIEADLIVEVAHPDISKKYALDFLNHADYMIGSPTALANRSLEESIKKYIENHSERTLYIPKGALWYLTQIQDLSNNGLLVEMNVTMKKHPLSINYCGPLKQPLSEITQETVIYKGDTRTICDYAPNNVNTIAVAALASSLGMDKVQATLIADPELDAHIIEIELYSHGEPGKRYMEKAYRFNPALKGAVTGNATYQSFLNSLKKTRECRGGIQFC